jgi:hypothetical protein
VKLSCQPRSAAWLLATVDARNPEGKRYAPGQINGVPALGATWCNRFVADVTADLGVPVPLLLANDQCGWLDDPLLGGAAGWARVDESAALLAVARGEPVVAGRCNPAPKGHGHVAIVVPGTPGLGLYVSQAGAKCFRSKPISSGFGNLPFSLWRHP